MSLLQTQRRPPRREEASEPIFGAHLTAPLTNPDASLQGADKARYVGAMFSRIAARYDLMNALITFGQDGAWRRYMVRQTAAAPGTLALDVATGTGRIAQELTRSGATAIGIDFSIQMMLEGRRNGVGASEPVYFAAADALNLPFEDATFDCVTTGFAMRNVIDIMAAFREMVRVLKPGGRLVCLEVGRPRSAITRFFHDFYCRNVVPFLGRVIAGDADAYSYLPSSMGKFPPPEDLARIMHSAGLSQVRFRQLTLGAAAVHTGIK